MPDAIEVIIPARGQVPWMRESLESIARQTVQPGLVTVIDDGLADADAMRRGGAALFGARFNFLRNPGSGISSALNTAIRQSRAAWIARMDADDVAHPNRLERQAAFLSARPEAAGCGSQVRFINGAGKILARSRLPEDWPRVRARLYSRTCFVHSSMMFRRNALARTLYRPSMDGAEDVDLALRLTDISELANIGDTLLDYRLHDAQESFRARARTTAVQELAFRSALARANRRADALERDPALAQRFIEWRLSDPAYCRARAFLTALRYGRTFLAGLDLAGFSEMASAALHSFPVSWSCLRICTRVAAAGGAALLREPTPFPELNVP